MAQKGLLKPWHEAVLRLTLPIVWIFLLVCFIFSFVFLVVPCAIAACVSWIICGDAHQEYTVVWCVFPLFIIDLYTTWLKTNGVIKLHDNDMYGDCF